MKNINNTPITRRNKASDPDVLASQLADNAHQSVTTTFNSDGSITESYASGLTKTTTFNSNGTITETYSAPINKTKITTFNSDGSISEVVS